jgi:hypothetical protein
VWRHLPGRCEELFVDGLDETAMVVADDQPDTTEAALDEPTDEARPS